MSVFSLNQTFRRLTILGKNVTTMHYHTTKYMEPVKILPILTKSKLNENQLKHPYDLSINFSPRSINLDLNLPTNGQLIKNIIESPFIIKHEIENPLRFIIQKIDITPDKSLDLPALGNETLKSAKESILIIRRKKIKKHKRRKFRRRMAATFLKINKRRGVKREKMFQAELWAKVKEAQKFNAKEYVASRIELLTREIIPPVYKGVILPESMVKKFMDEDKKRKEMRKNKPVLKL